MSSPRSKSPTSTIPPSEPIPSTSSASRRPVNQNNFQELPFAYNDLFPDYSEDDINDSDKSDHGGEECMTDAVDSEDEKHFTLDHATMIKAKNSKTYKSKIYTELIQHGQGFEDKDGKNGFDVENVLAENVIKGYQLGTIRNPGQPDLYHATLHSKLCSEMLKFSFEKIGDKNIFNSNEYINAMKQLRLENELPRIVSKIYSKCCFGFINKANIPSLSYCLLGSLQYDSSDYFEQQCHQKDKMGSTTLKRSRSFDENLSQATQFEIQFGPHASGDHHVPNKTHTQYDNDDSAAADNKDDGPNRKRPKNNNAALSKADMIAKKMCKILKAKSKNRAKPFHLFDFTTNKESLERTIFNTFYFGFLIRDGFASLSNKKGVGDSHSHDDDQDWQSNLWIKPMRKQNGVDFTSERNQCIVSFSSKMYKQMIEVAEGENEIPSDIDQFGSN